MDLIGRMAESCAVQFGVFRILLVITHENPHGQPQLKADPSRGEVELRDLPRETPPAWSEEQSTLSLQHYVDTPT